MGYELSSFPQGLCPSLSCLRVLPQLLSVPSLLAPPPSSVHPFVICFHFSGFLRSPACPMHTSSVVPHGLWLQFSNLSLTSKDLASAFLPCLCHPQLPTMAHSPECLSHIRALACLSHPCLCQHPPLILRHSDLPLSLRNPPGAPLPS